MDAARVSGSWLPRAPALERTPAGEEHHVPGVSVLGANTRTAAGVDVCQLETQGDVRRPAAQTIASATSLSAAPERAHGNRLTWSRVLCVSGLL